MTSINSKLGLKPRTRARRATHASALVSNVSCPDCGSAHVVRTQSRNGRDAGDFMCGGCGNFFDLEEVMTVGDTENPKPDENPTPGPGNPKPGGGEPKPATE